MVIKVISLDKHILCHTYLYFTAKYLGGMPATSHQFNKKNYHIMGIFFLRSFNVHFLLINCISRYMIKGAVTYLERSYLIEKMRFLIISDAKAISMREREKKKQFIFLNPKALTTVYALHR